MTTLGDRPALRPGMRLFAPDGARRTILSVTATEVTYLRGRLKGNKPVTHRYPLSTVYSEFSDWGVCSGRCPKEKIL